MAVIVVATLAVYVNTLRVPFIFDDIPSIVDNDTIRQLWPPGRALSPPAGWGFTVSGRPVLNYSFALNYAVSGLGVWSYHALNLLIHVLAGLTLFGLVRRTLARPPLAARFGAQAGALAAVVAVIWTLHPLQTESVTYAAQRAESLMGWFFLTTLYAFVRSVDSSCPRRWWAVSFLGCLLSVGTKEVAALAPIMVVLYDRTFVSGSFRAAWQRHRWLHLALAATWVPLALLLASTGGNRGGTIGFDVGVSWTGYWLTQFEAITRYLTLAFWPHPLVFDYGKIAAPGTGETLLWAIPVVALFAVTLVALQRWPVAAFSGAWFFALLAPTSLVPGTQQMIVEHRMYLPLAAVIAIAVGAAARWLRPRTIIVAGAVIALTAGAITAQRNAVYASETALWEDVLAKRPDNARAQNNLGRALYQQGRIDAAIAHYRESVRLDPGDAHTHYNLGLALIRVGRPGDAVAPLTAAVQLLPYFASAQLNLGIVLTQLDRAEVALPHLAEAIQFDASPADAHFQLGVALAKLGRWPEAIKHYGQALQFNPTYAEAHSNWGAALVQLNSVPAALGHFDEALRLKPDLPDAHFNLAVALAQLGRMPEAIAHYREAVRLNPQHFAAQLNLGIALAQTKNLSDAISQLERTVRLWPDSSAAHTNLGTALDETGRTTEALAHYTTALRLQPGSAQAHYNVGYALLAAGRAAEARPYFESALRIRPGFTAARELLRRLQESAPPP